MKSSTLAALLLLAALPVMAQVQPQTPQDKPASPASAAIQYTGGTKLNPEAKSSEENIAYAKLIAIQDPDAFAAAATEFATKYAGSTLNGAIFQQSMLLYRQTGNMEKALDAGRKSLSFDDGNPMVKAVVAGIIAQSAHTTDLDFADKAKEAVQLANDALANADQLRSTKGHAAADIENAKTMLRYEASDALGRIYFLARDYEKAELNFQHALDLFPSDPDAVELYLLALSQRNQNKLAPAIENLTKAAETAKAHNQNDLLPSLEKLKADTQAALDKQKAVLAK